MELTIRTFPDLLRILEQYPNWRRKLVKVLYPEIDVPKALQELAKAQRRTEAGLQRLEALVEGNTKRLVRVELGLQEAAASRQAIREEAAADRQAIREEMAAGFAEAATDRQAIREEMAAGFAEAAGERKKLEEHMKAGFAEAGADRQGIKRRLDRMDTTLNQLKGDTYEQKIRVRATGIFGRYIRRGRDVTNDVGERLEEAEDNGLISEREHDQVLAADLLWSGKLKTTKENLVLVLEASWWAEETDVKRAASRAAILRRCGVKALAVVAGNDGWADRIPEMALKEGVVMMTALRIDKASWKAGVAVI